MDLKDIQNWLQAFEKYSNDKAIMEKVILSPSHPYLYLTHQAGFKTAAQDVSLIDEGAHTGETGGFQLKNFCSYCIVGHSERQESFDVVLDKRDQCLKNGITPIVCFTETDNAINYYTQGVLLAWEDPSNISVNGVYRAKDPQEIRTNVNVIKATLPAGVELIYGGSINRQNIGELCMIIGLDGVLVGNASLDPQHFYEICKH